MCNEGTLDLTVWNINKTTMLCFLEGWFEFASLFYNLKATDGKKTHLLHRLKKKATRINTNTTTLQSIRFFATFYGTDILTFPKL